MTDLPIAGEMVPLLQGGFVASTPNIRNGSSGSESLDTELQHLNRSILHWKFNASVTDETNPGLQFLAINNANKDNVTVVSFSTRSNSDNAQFDEPLTRLRRGDGIFIQERTATNISIFYRVTGAPTLDGTKVNVPVARERDQGGEFTDQAQLNVKFFFMGSGDSLQLVRSIGDASSPLITVDATSATTFASSLTGVTVQAGDAFRVATAGAPFTGITQRASVNDVLVAVVDSPSLTNSDHWVLLKRFIDANPSGSQVPLPAPLLALNNGANVFAITHSDYRSNSPHLYLNNAGAVLKNAPTVFPNTAGVFANEITGSAASVSDPDPVTAIQDPSTLTSNIMTGAAIVNDTFRITPNDETNWRVILGGWLYYSSLPSSYQSILQIKERSSTSMSPVLRDIFGMGPNGITFKARATTGSTVNTGVRHLLTSTNGLPLEELSGATLSTSFRVYSARTFGIQIVGRNGGALVGGELQDYVVTDVDVSQAQSTINFNLGAGTQSVNVQYDASSTRFGGSQHIITVSVTSIIAGLDQLDVDILLPSTTVATSSGNTYNDLTISDGHAASGRLMRYIASFRSVNGVESGNLQCVLAFAGYDSLGRPTIFEENTFDLLYPALDLNWDHLIYGGQGVHQNVQWFVLNGDTPLFQYPRHSTEDDWLSHYDRKADQWCWGNVHGPSQDTEAVHFNEFVEFSNLILVAPNGTKYRLGVDNSGNTVTTVVT